MKRHSKGKPVGLLPTKFWILNRQADIIAAMNRYSNANLPIPEIWVQELALITSEIAKEQHE
jgi:hypothetical protein